MSSQLKSHLSWCIVEIPWDNPFWDFSLINLIIYRHPKYFTSLSFSFATPASLNIVTTNHYKIMNLSTLKPRATFVFNITITSQCTSSESECMQVLISAPRTTHCLVPCKAHRKPSNLTVGITEAYHWPLCPTPSQVLPAFYLTGSRANAVTSVVLLKGILC